MADQGDGVSPEHELVNAVRSEAPHETSMPQPVGRKKWSESSEQAHSRRGRAPEDYVERTRKLGAENFDGSGAPDDVIVCLDLMDDICQMMKYTDEQKVNITTFLFKGRVRDYMHKI